MKTSEKAMRKHTLPPEILPELVAAAEGVISDTATAAPVKHENGALSEPDIESAAEMAAGWCRAFAGNPRFRSTAEYGISGLAAAVILSASRK